MKQHLQPSPCGIIYRSCRHMNEGYAGCFQGGGSETCYMCDCCKSKQINGCWQCDDFPCERLLKIEPAWQGMTIGLIKSVKKLGEEKFSVQVLKNIGEYAEYGDMRFKSPDEIQSIINVQVDY